MTRNVNESSQATRNSTRKAHEKLEFFCISLNLKKKIYISTLGDDINNISLFFFLKNHKYLLFI